MTTTRSSLRAVEPEDALDRYVAAFAALRAKGVGPARLRRVLDAAHRRGVTLRELARPEHRGLWSECGVQAPDDAAATDGALADRLRKRGVDLIVAGEDVALPPTAPPILFTRGASLLLSRPGVGFCGSREATERGVAVARDLADQLAARGITSVSGGARGVDTAAHVAALGGGGATVIVLAEGIDAWSPRTALRDAIDPARTLVVSEFHPADRWLAGRAMQRNHTICALSAALVLIEARTEGGTFAAGEAALRIGLPLFCAVYASATQASDGNRVLLARGATPLMQSRSTGRANLTPVLRAIEASAGALNAASGA